MHATSKGQFVQGKKKYNNNMKIKAKCKLHKLKRLQQNKKKNKSCIHYKNKQKLTIQCRIYIMGIVQTKIQISNPFNTFFLIAD